MQKLRDLDAQNNADVRRPEPKRLEVSQHVELAKEPALRELRIMHCQLANGISLACRVPQWYWTQQSKDQERGETRQ